MYNIPIWELLGKKQNLLGYIPFLSFSSPAVSQSSYLVKEIFLPRKKLMDLSLSLSPYKNQYSQTCFPICCVLLFLLTPLIGLILSVFEKLPYPTTQRRHNLLGLKPIGAQSSF